MLDLIKTVRNELLNESEVTDYVGNRIHMAFKPVGNTVNDYPQITILANDGPTDSLTNDYFPDLQLHIWTKDDAYVTQANLIAKQVLIRLDRKGFSNPCIFQIWKSNSISIYEDETKTFHLTLIFNVVMKGYE